MAFIRQFKTGSGAIGVQICWKEGRKVVKTVHIGSANSEIALKKLIKKARQEMMAGQGSMFDLSKFDGED